MFNESIGFKSSPRAKPGYSLLSVSPQQSTIHVRSLFCQGISKTKASPCFLCQKAGDQVAVIPDCALQDPEALSYGFLSHLQILRQIDVIKKGFKQERLKVYDF